MFYKECKQCGNSFPTGDARRKYCSRICYSERMKISRMGSGNPLFGVRPSAETIRKRVESLRRTGCSAWFKSGPPENHPRWISDRSKVIVRPHNDVQSRRWRSQVYARDSYMCKIKDKNCRGRLEAHHIDPWKEYEARRYDVANGITLCHYHHPRSLRKVQEMKRVFFSIISSV